MLLGDDQVEAAFPQYEFVSTLKPGGFKTPYLVRTPDGLESVLKVYKAPFDEEDSSVHLRALRELRLLDDLDHPHIAQLASEPDFISIDGAQYLYYLEVLARNGTVADRNLPVSIELALKWILQMLDVLEYLEDRNVVHRDIKPANVGLNENDDVVLLDLGVALDMDDETITEVMGVAPGTRAYASPEQLSPRKLVSLDHRADQYSLGVLSCELITGERIADPSDWPQDGRVACLRRVVDRMTARNPNQRFRRVRMVRSALEGCL